MGRMKEMFMEERQLSYQDVNEYYEWSYRPEIKPTNIIIVEEPKRLTEEQEAYKNYVKRI